MHLSSIVIVSIFIFGVTASRAQPQDNAVEDSTWRQTFKLLVECNHSPSTLVCLKMKAVKYLDKALLHKDPIMLTDYVSFATDPNVNEVEDDEELMKDIDLEETLPRSLDERDGALDQILEDKLASFFNRRSLQLSLPMAVTEGRGKKGKYGGMLMMGVAMAGMMAQLMMGKIAMIAGKALIVAKVALVLSAVIGIKKLFSKEGGGGEHQVVYSQGGGDHGGGGWSRRSLGEEVNEQANDMAYNAYVTKGDEETYE